MSTALLVYIAGPCTTGGTQADNLRSALEAAERVHQAGHVPLVPHLVFLWELAHGSPSNAERWYTTTMRWMLACNVVYRIPGESVGADAEVAEAQERGIPVVHSVEELAAFAAQSGDTDALEHASLQEVGVRLGGIRGQLVGFGAWRLLFRVSGSVGRLADAAASGTANEAHVYEVVVALCAFAVAYGVNPDGAIVEVVRELKTRKYEPDGTVTGDEPDLERASTHLARFVLNWNWDGRLSSLGNWAMAWVALRISQGPTNPQTRMLGVIEELGELAHALLKGSQGIRGVTPEKERELVANAVADVFVFLATYAVQNGINPDTAAIRAAVASSVPRADAVSGAD